MGFLGVWAVGSRAAQAFMTAPQAARNIYEQQYQMGLFVRDNFPGALVTVSDVGAVNFLADVRCLDIDGLASKEAFDLKLKGALTRDTITTLSQDSALAILYERVFAAGRLPSAWRKAGSWRISNNVICGDDTVYFYSTGRGDEATLIAKLREFGARLPSDIAQDILDAPHAAP